MSDAQERIIVLALVFFAMYSFFDAYQNTQRHSISTGVHIHKTTVAREAPAPFSYRWLYPVITQRIVDAIQ